MNHTTLPVTDMDIRLARAYINGAMDEDELRSGFVPADAAIIEALKQMLAEEKAEHENCQADLMAAIGKITVLEREIHHLKERGAA
ncbi:MAG: hypothetical protein ACYC5F_09615 [Thermoleophilia bacterium]